MTKTFKIVRGTYLTGLGQEPSAYYFKVSESDADFETIAPGDVALTFYQNGETITSLPAERQVNEFLHSEKKDHLPMLPIVAIYDDFDPLVFNKIMTSFQELKQDMKRLAKLQVIQGNLFDFLDKEDSL